MCNDFAQNFNDFERHKTVAWRKALEDGADAAKLCRGGLFVFIDKNTGSCSESRYDPYQVCIDRHEAAMWISAASMRPPGRP